MSKGQSSPEGTNDQGQLLANSGETRAAAPAKADPAQVEPALTIVVVEATDTAVAARTLPERAEGYDRELLLHFRIATAELEQLGHGRRTQAVRIQSLEHGLRAHVLVEVLENDFALMHLVGLEVAIVDVGVAPAVVALLDEVVDAVSEDVQRIDFAEVGDKQLGDLLTELAILDDPTQVVVAATESIDFLGDQLDHLEGRAQGTNEFTLLTSHGFLSFFRYTSYLHTMQRHKAHQQKRLL